MAALVRVQVTCDADDCGVYCKVWFNLDQLDDAKYGSVAKHLPQGWTEIGIWYSGYIHRCPRHSPPPG